MTEDSKLTELFFERSEQAIALLSEKYGALCLSTSMNILSSRQDAEECVNDAYLAVWNTIPPQRPDPLSAYVCRIVRNLSLKKLRSNSALKRGAGCTAALEELEGSLSDDLSVEEEAEARELARLIDKFLGTLDKNERVLFVRRYWFFDSTDTLARMFATSEHNISARLYRTREKLRKYLKKEGAAI